jgi:hypothetical protein
MARYQTHDGKMADTEKARESWEEKSDFNGNNFISRATGSQWKHETLYLSAKGNYYIEHTSQWQGSMPGACFVDPCAAAQWLLNNGHELPEDLQKFEEALIE